ncbi:hypothetical protein Barb6_03530 [Bacteroidales bacterium Barb6]|nr:hypothetical protein Barb6_03530 [Bacteroidales bacterium Barb6]
MLELVEFRLQAVEGIGVLRFAGTAQEVVFPQGSFVLVAVNRQGDGQHRHEHILAVHLVHTCCGRCGTHSPHLHSPLLGSGGGFIYQHVLQADAKHRVTHLPVHLRLCRVGKSLFGKHAKHRVLSDGDTHDFRRIQEERDLRKAFGKDNLRFRRSVEQGVEAGFAGGCFRKDGFQRAFRLCRFQLYAQDLRHAGGSSVHAAHRISHAAHAAGVARCGGLRGRGHIHSAHSSAACRCCLRGRLPSGFSLRRRCCRLCAAAGGELLQGEGFQLVQEGKVFLRVVALLLQTTQEIPLGVDVQIEVVPCFAELLEGHLRHVLRLRAGSFARAEPREHLHQSKVCRLPTADNVHRFKEKADIKHRVGVGTGLRYLLQGSLVEMKSGLNGGVVCCRLCQIVRWNHAGRLCKRLRRRTESGCRKEKERQDVFERSKHLSVVFIIYLTPNRV